MAGRGSGAQAREDSAGVAGRGRVRAALSPHGADALHNAPPLTNGEVRKLKAQRHSDILCELVARPRIITRHEREAASVSPEDPCVTIYMTRDVLAVGRGHVPLFRRAHSPVN